MKKSLCLLVVAVTILFAACQREALQGDNNGPHQVKVYLTDHQTPLFDSVFVDLRGLDVKLEDDTLRNGGWINLATTSGVYNILRLRNGIDTLFATGSIPNQRIRKIRLRLGTQNSVMLNGQTTPLRIKDEDREVIINIDDSNFDISSNGQVFFWIDFDAGNSIQPDNSGPGNGNGYRLKSHIKAFSHTKSGRIEGRVFPLAARPIVKAVINSDTATAIPDSRDGKYKIVGLRAGIYKLIIDAQNGFTDTTINNVIVRNGEDTHVPPVTLH